MGNGADTKQRHGNACGVTYCTMTRSLQAHPSGTRGVSQGEKPGLKNFQVEQHILSRKKIMDQGTCIT